MDLHFGTSNLEEDGRIDWKIKDMEAVKELLLNKGKLKVSIIDISNQKLGVDIDVDELMTVEELWEEVKNNIDKMCPWSNIKVE